MATQFDTIRDSRLVVLLSAAEKKRLADRARAADMSLSEFVRTAADSFEHTPDIPEELLAELADEVRAAVARANTALASLERSAARADAFDEQALRQRIRQHYSERADIDWHALAETLGLAGEAAE